VVLVLIFVAAAAYLINTDATGIQVYDVYPTISMLPTMEVGDLVVVHSVSYSSIQMGDVIVFARPDQSGACTSEVIVHRVVEITSQGFITQGDDRVTNPSPDEPTSWPPVPANCVKGVVVVAVPYLGRIGEAFPPPYNYVLVAAILALVFALELRPKSSEQREERDEGAPSPAEGTTAGIDSGSASETR
jgi:signal peptidase I